MCIRDREYTTGATITAAIAVTLVLVITGEHLGRVNGGDWFWIVLLAVVPGSGHLIMNWAHLYLEDVYKRQGLSSVDRHRLRGARGDGTRIRRRYHGSLTGRFAAQCVRR